MTVVRSLCGLAAVLLLSVGSARAVEPASLDDMVNGYLEAIAVADGIAMGTSCEMQLNNSGVGSQCRCNADGNTASCTCSGQGNNTVCSCTDSSGTMYCYFCNNGGGCRCGKTKPTNPPHDPCQ